MTEVVQVKRDDLRYLLDVLRDAQDALDLKSLEDGEALLRHVMAVSVLEEFHGPFCAACGRLRDEQR